MIAAGHILIRIMNTVTYLAYKKLVLQNLHTLHLDADPKWGQTLSRSRAILVEILNAI